MNSGIYLVCIKMHCCVYFNFIGSHGVDIVHNQPVNCGVIRFRLCCVFTQVMTSGNMCIIIIIIVGATSWFCLRFHSIAKEDEPRLHILAWIYVLYFLRCQLSYSARAKLISIWSCLRNSTQIQFRKHSSVLNASQFECDRLSRCIQQCLIHRCSI